MLNVLAKNDIYQLDKVLRNRLKLLENDNEMIAVNKQNILDFQQYLASDGVSAGRRARYILYLSEIAKRLNG